MNSEIYYGFLLNLFGKEHNKELYDKCSLMVLTDSLGIRSFALPAEKGIVYFYSIYNTPYLFSDLDEFFEKYNNRLNDTCRIAKKDIMFNVFSRLKEVVVSSLPDKASVEIYDELYLIVIDNSFFITLPDDTLDNSFS